MRLLNGVIPLSSGTHAFLDCFTAESTGRDGNVSQSIIYVTAPKAADAKPEFTIVVR